MWWIAVFAALSTVGGVVAYVAWARQSPVFELDLESTHIRYELDQEAGRSGRCTAFVFNASDVDFEGDLRFEMTPDATRLSADFVKHLFEATKPNFLSMVPKGTAPDRAQLIMTMGRACLALNHGESLLEDPPLPMRCEGCATIGRPYGAVIQATITARTGKNVTFYLDVPSHVLVHPVKVVLRK